MEKIHSNIKKVINNIKIKTGNNPDIIIKENNINDNDIAVVFSESLADRTVINDFILEYLEELKQLNENINNVFEYLSKNLPTHKIIKVRNYNDLFYNLLSGYTLIIINDNDTILSIETKAKLDSGVSEATNEVVIKGPKDAFTENYQTNIGLIRKRIKSETLWIEEHIIGNKSKTKVGVMYVKNIGSTKLFNQINEKVKTINIDGVFDSNYIIETISGNKKNVFPIYISTERPDVISMHLLDGRIAIVVENTPFVMIVPAFFIDFFHNPEDYYQKNLNVNFTRIIRFLAFIIGILAPALYIAVTTYNLEAVPAELLLNFSAQREGVPLPSFFEIFLMIIIFEILRETDTRLPNAIGSSLSIVGAIVLGQAAVAAGIVSPITIIVVSVTAISGLITTSIDIINGIRWWRVIFLLFSSIAGIIGVLVAGLIFVINLCSIKSFGIPYLVPIAPFYRIEQKDAIFLTNKKKYNQRNHLTARSNNERQVP